MTLSYILIAGWTEIYNIQILQIIGHIEVIADFLSW